MLNFLDLPYMAPHPSGPPPSVSLVGETITLSFYDNSAHGDPVESITPELLIESRSFTITPEPEAPDYNSVSNWLAADEFGDIGSPLTFLYNLPSTGSHPTSNESFSLYNPTETANSFYDFALFVISVTSEFTDYTPVLEWDNGDAFPALPTMVFTDGKIILDLGFYILPSVASTKSLRIRLVPH